MATSGEREFEIRENPAGRFHLTRFGVNYGGTDRNERFVIVVRDRHGNEIARSLPTTARQLSIAERGRQDYDANCFHQTDFFAWDDDAQRAVPRSAIARRARWIRDRREA